MLQTFSPYLARLSLRTQVACQVPIMPFLLLVPLTQMIDHNDEQLNAYALVTDHASC